MKKHLLSMYGDFCKNKKVVDLGKTTYETSTVETTDADEFLAIGGTYETRSQEISDPDEYTLGPTSITKSVEATDEDEYTYVSVEGEYELVDAVITGIVLDTEKAYDIIAVIEAEGYTAVSRHTYIAAAYYIIDVNTDGTAIGFGTAVDDEDNGLISGFPIAINDESGEKAFSVGLDGIPHCRNVNSDFGNNRLTATSKKIRKQNDCKGNHSNQSKCFHFLIF